MENSKLRKLLDKVEDVLPNSDLEPLNENLAKKLTMLGGFGSNGSCSANSGCSGNSECSNNQDCCNNGCCNSGCRIK